MQQLGIQTSMDTMFVWKSTPVLGGLRKKKVEKKRITGRILKEWNMD